MLSTAIKEVCIGGSNAYCFLNGWWLLTWYGHLTVSHTSFLYAYILILPSPQWYTVTYSNLVYPPQQTKGDHQWFTYSTRCITTKLFLHMM